MTATDHRSVTNTPRSHGAVSPTTRATGLAFAAWCLGFAAVNAWQLASEAFLDEFGDHSTLLTVMSVVVLTGAPVLLGGLLVVLPSLLTTASPR